MAKRINHNNLVKRKQTKLPADDESNIRSLVNQGYTITSIAKEFDITRKTVYAIIERGK